MTRPQRLGVELLAEGRRAGHVGEQDRHELADLAQGGDRELGLMMRMEEMSGFKIGSSSRMRTNDPVAKC